MPLTTKDVTGLVLVVGTLGLLIVHGTGRHEAESPSPGAARDTVSIGSLTRATSTSGASAVVFVDVNLINHLGDGARRNQVVVVDEGTVTEVGPVGTVTASPGALVVHGAGSDFLLAAVTLPSGRMATLDPSRPIVPGVRTDLVLLGGDPRVEQRALDHPEGLLRRGAWFHVGTGEPGGSGRSTAVGGH